MSTCRETKLILTGGSLIAILMIVTFSSMCHAQSYTPNDEDKTVAPSRGVVPSYNKPMDVIKVKQEKFSLAEVMIPIIDMGYANNSVTFTIPENAMQYDQKAEQVTISGVYKRGKNLEGTCPIVESTEVNKSTENYNPFSGRARIKATFSSEKMAKAAYEQECLLIHDKK